MKRNLIFIVILACSICVFGQSKTAKESIKKKVTQTQKKEGQKTTIQFPITNEEYAVFMTILGKNANNFVIVKKIDGGETTEEGIENLKLSFDELDIETVKDYALKNKETILIEKKFPTKNHYTLISDEEIKKFFGTSLKWKEFYKKYPKSGGMYSFSRVGFSKDGKQAFVSVGQSCGALCGQGKIYLLQKENGDWKIVKEKGTWIS